MNPNIRCYKIILKDHAYRSKSDHKRRLHIPTLPKCRICISTSNQSSLLYFKIIIAKAHQCFSLLTALLHLSFFTFSLTFPSYLFHHMDNTKPTINWGCKQIGEVHFLLKGLNKWDWWLSTTQQQRRLSKQPATAFSIKMHVKCRSTAALAHFQPRTGCILFWDLWLIITCRGALYL